MVLLQVEQGELQGLQLPLMKTKPLGHKVKHCLFHNRVILVLQDVQVLSVIVQFLHGALHLPHVEADEANNPSLHLSVQCCVSVILMENSLAQKLHTFLSPSLLLSLQPLHELSHFTHFLDLVPFDVKPGSHLALHWPPFAIK